MSRQNMLTDMETERGTQQQSQVGQTHLPVEQLMHSWKFSLSIHVFVFLRFIAISFFVVFSRLLFLRCFAVREFEVDGKIKL